MKLPIKLIKTNFIKMHKIGFNHAYHVISELKIYTMLSDTDLIPILSYILILEL